MTKCAKRVVGFITDVGNVFIKRLQTFFFKLFFYVFTFLTFFYFYINVYYIYGKKFKVGILSVNRGNCVDCDYPVSTHLFHLCLFFFQNTENGRLSDIKYGAWMPGCHVSSLWRVQQTVSQCTVYALISEINM